MPKLHAVVAIHKDATSKARSKFAELKRLISAKDLFVGQIRTNEPLDGDVPPLPEESSKVQYTVPNVVDLLSDTLIRWFDITATRDFGSTDARGDVTLPDGTVLVQQVPVDFLLFLETEIKELVEFARLIPIYSSAEDWDSQHDGTYRSREKLTRQMAKTPRAHVKWAPPSPEFRQDAQTETWWAEEHVGNWRTVKFTGAITPGAHADLMQRLTTLNHAVKTARENANSINVEEQRVGRSIMDYIFGPIGLTSH